MTTSKLRDAGEEADVTLETERVTLRLRPEALSFSPRLLGAALTAYSVQKSCGRKFWSAS
jgi:hypothetical protein